MPKNDKKSAPKAKPASGQKKTTVKSPETLDEKEARLAEKEAKLAEREAELNDKARSLKRKREAKLIPAPPGQSGRKKGGYNLQEVLGLSDKDYQRRYRMVKRFTYEHMSNFEAYGLQSKQKAQQMLIKVVIRLLTFRHIREAYLKQEIARTFLGGEQKRRRKDDAEEEAAWAKEQAELEQEPSSKRPKLPTSSKSKSKATQKRISKRKIVESSSDSEDDAEVLSPGPDDDDTDWEDIEEEDDSSDVKQVRMVDANEQEQFPAKDDETVDENDREYFPDNDDDPREFNDHVMIVDEKENRAPTPASPAAAGVQTLATPAKKIDKGKGRAHNAQVSRAARNKHATETPEAALTWDTLPKTCPSVMCTDTLPREPVAKILSLFEKRRAQQKLGDKGLRIIELEICIAITTERRKGAVFAMGQRRQWLPKFNPHDLARRLVEDELCNSYVGMILDPAYLAPQPIWQEFLLAINYKLLAFEGSQNKREFPALLEHRACEYYGPQGVYLITSCLRHYVSTVADHMNLEVMLYKTMDSIVLHDEDHFDYGNFTSANHMSLQDFVDYVLVPYSATRLIMEDLSYDSYDNASMERFNSKEYGELFNPEDDFDEAADAVLRTNVREMKRLPGAQQFQILHPRLKSAEPAATSSSAPVALPSSSRRTPPVTHQTYAPASVGQTIAPPAPNASQSSSRDPLLDTRQLHVGGSGSRFAASPWLGPKSPPSSAFGDRFVPSSSTLNNRRYMFPTTASPFGGPSTSSHRYPHSSVTQGKTYVDVLMGPKPATAPVKTEPSGLTTPLLHTSAPPKHRRALAATRPPSVQNAVMTEKSTPQVIEVDGDASVAKSTTKPVEVVAGGTAELMVGVAGGFKIRLPPPKAVVQMPITLADYEEPKNKPPKSKQVPGIGQKRQRKAPQAEKDSGDAQTRRTSKRLNPQN
ncbi:hypothetical protein R3P38DRAFT_3189601 [Favolaschia claudopus]|uniref:Restriction of telomere capping protein 4 C-terminal domain-containing protein n=1 Tax=Favolaschia claudopus TaxID=2862362 RepID=A0AAW0BSZ8_9AGAR